MQSSCLQNLHQHHPAEDQMEGGLQGVQCRFTVQWLLPLPLKECAASIAPKNDYGKYFCSQNFPSRHGASPVYPPGLWFLKWESWPAKSLVSSTARPQNLCQDRGVANGPAACHRLEARSPFPSPQMAKLPLVATYQLLAHPLSDHLVGKKE